MAMNYGVSAAAAAPSPPEQEPARYLVLIDAGGPRIARLYLASRVAVAEFDAGAEEVTRMTGTLLPTRSALQPEWDAALAGHSEAERRGADVYTLAV